MSMKKNICLLFFLILSLSGKAQDGYCLSFGDYQSNIWHTVENLRFEYRSGNKSLWHRGASFKPVTDDKKTDKILKKEARLILYHDSLYINCRGLSYQHTKFGNWYAPACIFSHEYFLFTALSTKAIKQTAYSSMMFGVIGGAIAASKYKEDYMCYVFYPNSNTVEAVDQKMMNQLLEDHPILKEQYAKVDEVQQHAPETVIPILQELGLINESPLLP